jgi:hypothetical protein
LDEEGRLLAAFGADQYRAGGALDDLGRVGEGGRLLFYLGALLPRAPAAG